MADRLAKYGGVDMWQQWAMRWRTAIVVLLGLFLMLACVQVQAVPSQNSSSLPVFHNIKSIKKLKSKFIAYMLPLIKRENSRIYQQRQYLLSLDALPSLSEQQQDDVIKVAHSYGLTHLQPPITDKAWQTILARVDVVPVSMTIAQAANESNWGRSRFARKGNNLFGQWCFSKGCGLVPSRRPDGEIHEVRRFSSPLSSIQSYFRNLNTQRSYASFRKMREQLRENNQSLLGLVLSKGLSRYSSKGKQYITLIQNIIRSNNLTAYDKHRHAA